MPRGRKPPTKAEIILRLGFLCVSVAVLGVLAFFSGLGAWHMFQKERDVTYTVDSTERQLALVVAQKQQVASATEELSTETGQEAALRERYGVTKPGEGIIQIVEHRPATSTADDVSHQSFLTKIVHIFWPW